MGVYEHSERNVIIDKNDVDSVGEGHCRYLPWP